MYHYHQPARWRRQSRRLWRIMGGHQCRQIAIPADYVPAEEAAITIERMIDAGIPFAFGQQLARDLAANYTRDRR